jgi:hypothetical protein
MAANHTPNPNCTSAWLWDMGDIVNLIEEWEANGASD